MFESATVNEPSVFKSVYANSKICIVCLLQGEAVYIISNNAIRSDTSQSSQHEILGKGILKGNTHKIDNSFSVKFSWPYGKTL